jgi:hypothetical protein
MQAKTERRFHELNCEPRICNLPNGVNSQSLWLVSSLPVAHTQFAIVLFNPIFWQFVQNSTRLGWPGVRCAEVQESGITVLSSLLRSSGSRG